MSVTIGTGTNPAGPPKALFEFRSAFITASANVFAFSPSPDGQRFLVDAFATDAQPTLEVITIYEGLDNPSNYRSILADVPAGLVVAVANSCAQLSTTTIRLAATAVSSSRTIRKR